MAIRGIKALPSISLHANEPLHKRVPKQDRNGRLLSDFMILIPGLRDWPMGRFVEVVSDVQVVLHGFREVVYADLNVPLNLLWVSVESRPGVIRDIVVSLLRRVPEARVVTARF